MARHTTFVLILYNLEACTLITQVFVLIRAMSLFSIHDKSFNSSGMSPNQRPFANAFFGVLPFFITLKQVGHTPSQFDASTGPGRLSMGSLILTQAFLVTSGRYRRDMFKPAELTSVSWDFSVRRPHTAHPFSSSLEKSESSTKPFIIFWVIRSDTGLGGKLFILRHFLHCILFSSESGFTHFAAATIRVEMGSRMEVVDGGRQAGSGGEHGRRRRAGWY